MGVNNPEPCLLLLASENPTNFFHTQTSSRSQGFQVLKFK
jgi:hypothetical protein